MLTKKLQAEFELEVRNLYLFEGRKPAAISELLHEDIAAVQSVISRLGLAKLRKAAQKESLASSAELLVEHQQRITEVIAAQSEQHAITALRKTGEALRDDDSKSALRLSSTARNLVGIARTVSGESAEQVSSTQVNLFFVGHAEPKRVEAYSDLLE